MSLLRRIAREPLLHFLVIGAAVFVIAGLAGPDSEGPRERIVVTDGRIEQLAQVFTRTWQRPPAPEELRGLVDAWIKEEVYYREAVKLGLDRDDTLIRRRMQQKMEFLVEPADESLTPGDGDLERFLSANRERFRVEPVVAFEQVFVARRGDPPAAESRARELLVQLSEGAAPSEAAALGDPTLLPFTNPPAPLTRVAREYGAGFAGALEALPVGVWAGPVESAFGVHVVRIVERGEARDPALDEVRDAVLREWRQDRREAARSDAWRRLLDRYEVIVPAAAPDGARAR